MRVDFSLSFTLIIKSIHSRKLPKKKRLIVFFDYFIQRYFDYFIIILPVFGLTVVTV